MNVKQHLQPTRFAYYTRRVHTHKPIGFIKSTNSHMKCRTKIEIISRNALLVGLLPPATEKKSIALIC